MSQVDWSNAPEGAEGAMVADFGNNCIKFGCVQFVPRGDWTRQSYIEGPGHWIYIQRPDEEWNGQGLPPVDYLRERLSYDAITGSLVWLPRPQTDFTEKHHFASWVARCEGKQAGVVVIKKRKKYSRIDICGHKIYAHRVAWAIHHGQYPDAEIDHKNGNSLDNSILNLRTVSHQANSQNVMLQAKSRSGYCGVNWHAETGKWRARVKINGSEKYIGLFDDPAEAAIRIKAVRDALGFHENHGSSIRTAEQIAAEVRQEEIKKIAAVMSEVILATGSASVSAMAEAVYCDGYRKEVAP